MSVVARERGRYCQCPRRKSDQITSPVLEKWGDLILGSKANRPERLLSWSFRAVVAAGLMRDDILNTSPTHLVLTKEGLLVFAEKNQNAGKV